ncbi:MAG: carboxymuconolactone decarboxylase family protein [Thermoplasmatales archaeon]|jgi:alkylhydroperoxidase/carboxymuconolactone decarboxylase family protein YurZ|nr:carboxymuconolactone decarboxylase family protein [Candidatus Thermoplasmatota archaeon]MDA8055699.1 carboxymuconolactone decarboxylase family protein [Thermoplasmatales archaeon]
MSSNYEEVKKFADQQLGEMPQVIELLFGMDENSAMEQFLQNKTLYLGRTSLALKTRILIAISTALANGPKESAFIHFKLAKKFGIEPKEILDAMRITKMVLMSSTLDSVYELVKAYGELPRDQAENAEVVSILDDLQKKGGMVPDRVKSASLFSTNLLKEHLREKKVMLTPLKIQTKDVYAIALGVSASIRDRECQKVYLNQFLRNGGSREEAEDVLTTVRFLSGNRAYVNGIEILKNMNYQNNFRENVPP